jgi:hypothetical protein
MCKQFRVQDQTLTSYFSHEQRGTINGDRSVQNCNNFFIYHIDRRHEGISMHRKLFKIVTKCK